MTGGRPPSARTLRRRLVDGLATAGSLRDADVRRAFLAVPRERFLPEVAAAQGLAAVYANRAIVTRTGPGGTPTSSSSQPGIMALMLERLELRPGHRVLEIGAGTGYNAALLASLVGEGGRVTSIELDADLADKARGALVECGHPVDVVVGDGREGWPAAAPYDRIVATASTAALAPAWLDQLAPDGRVQVPVHLDGFDLQAVVTFQARGRGLRSTSVLDGGFMAMRSPGPPAGPTGLVTGGDGPAHAATISLSEFVDGHHRTVGVLAGDRLRLLRPAARTRLMALLLERPTGRRRLAPLPPGRSPGLFVRLARPRGAVTLSYFRTGVARSMYGPVAVATTDGRSLAVAAFRSEKPVRLETYGDPRAADVLVALLDDWRSRGRPSTGDLVVDVRFDGSGRSSLTTRWAQPSMVSSRQ